MAAQLGLNTLVKMDPTGSGSFTTIGGGQTTSFRINNELVDITSQDNATRWREALEGAGVKSVDMSIEGVFKDASIDTSLKNSAMNDQHDEYQFIIPSFGTFEGPFQVTLEYSGVHNGEVKFNASFASTNEIAFTPV